MKYRVWTKNSNFTISCMTDWMTKCQCEKYIIGRWGHWPPWAFVSKAQNTKAFIRANGD